jgi:hypothetical protein
MHAPDDDINMASGGAKILHLLYFLKRKRKGKKRKGKRIGERRRRRKRKKKGKEQN